MRVPQRRNGAWADHSTDWGGMEAQPREPGRVGEACNSFGFNEFHTGTGAPEDPMANSSFETFKQGGKAIDEAAEKTGQQAGGMYQQAKDAASGAYDSAAELAQDTVSRVQDTATDLDDMVSEQVGRHPKAMVALGIGLGFVLGVLYASSRGSNEPRWRDYARW